jgi:1,4-alpha-glucan branching enzyme
MTSTTKVSAPALNDKLKKLVNAQECDPFAVLGYQTENSKQVIRAFIPFCESVTLGTDGPELSRIENTDIFEYAGSQEGIAKHYQLSWVSETGEKRLEFDPYTFNPAISDYDCHLFSQGEHWHIYRILGAHHQIIDGTEGIRFAVWAPNAQRVSVISDLNRWDGRRHPMCNLGSSGLWSLFIPGMVKGDLYKYEILSRDNSQLLVKADPYAQQYEYRPKTASIVTYQSDFNWQDTDWVEQRTQSDWLHQPMSIYEVHLGSWRRGENNEFLNYRDLADQLVSYVSEMKFTHIELLPISEHPYDDSWGYQTLGYFAPTSRFGTPDDFRYFVDHCHQNNIGVILDWVPAHFPKDEHGLRQFDGTALYEHEDPRLGEHPDWGTLIYNYGRNEVQNFLLSSAVYWLEEFHIDGLRVDAVASLLYLDYSRKEDEWIPNKHGGNENLEAISFVRKLNTVTHGEFPGTLILAEESTSWPQVTKPVSMGGLGFSMKWNMGWMHDTLEYMSKQPVHRKHHHNDLTFGLLYAFSENFILPFSHDEVVHGKSSLVNKMPGDEWQKFANLRLLFLYMFTYPGKKLLFMGCEFAQRQEWNNKQSLDWHVLNHPLHRGVKDLVKDLNTIYIESPQLHNNDFDDQGFQWINCDDHEQSVLCYMRKFNDKYFIVVLNFTPVIRKNYKIGVPENTTYKEILNSDSNYYSGSNTGNGDHISTEENALMGFPYTLQLTLPPLAGIILMPA